MTTTIIDCYTDEPAGLGVPPYLGTYPRYIYGSVQGECFYLTIDDLRLYLKYNLNIPETKPHEKTRTGIYNLTKNYPYLEDILKKTTHLIVILGVHVPGKYLSANPGTLKELTPIVKNLKCKKTLTGPAATSYGTQLHGGGFKERTDISYFDKIKPYMITDYEKIAKVSIAGAGIVSQIPDLRIAEIETGRGCSRYPGCSYCTEPLKNKLEFRKKEDIVCEVKALFEKGITHFRLGKQSCFFTYGTAKEIEELLRPISKFKPDMLHIDNVNPQMITAEKTKAIVKYCTPGNVAALGVESFDEVVQEKNNLNCDNETVYNAVKIINKIGGQRSPTGMHYFLPGINILFGLTGESKETHRKNHENLKRFLDENLLLRRINIRKATPLEGTKFYEDAGNKYLKKNNKYYWKWRNSIRQDIDYPMLQKIAPAGMIIKDVRAEVYDGKTTFGRQLGTYPLILGVKERLELGKFYNIEVTGHMLRSIIGKVV
ncbi:MAG: radical SAM protein [Candidatus Nanoarchaeia archaeon]